jgi:hypothetical protein
MGLANANFWFLSTARHVSTMLVSLRSKLKAQVTTSQSQVKVSRALGNQGGIPDTRREVYN